MDLPKSVAYRLAGARATQLCCRPQSTYRYEETRWESFAADVLGGIVWRLIKQTLKFAEEIKSFEVNRNFYIEAQESDL